MGHDDNSPQRPIYSCKFLHQKNRENLKNLMYLKVLEKHEKSKPKASIKNFEDQKRN